MTALSTSRRLLGPGRIRPVGVVIAALVLAAGSYVAAAVVPAHPAPRPIGTTETQLALPAAQDGAFADLDDIDSQLAIWAPKAAADARDDISAGNVAILYLARGRFTGDAADYERALSAADRAVTANPASTGTRTLKATVLQATHDFRGALAHATSILAEEPGNIDAIVVSGDADVELGRLADAAAAYKQVEATIPGPSLDARLARLAWLSGDAREAVRLATQARDEAVGNDELSDPSFYAAQLGEMARLTGDAATAKTAYDDALATRSTNQLALLGRARLEAFGGADTAAIADLRTAAAIAPRPETLGLLADLLDRIGDHAGATQQADTIGVIERLGGTSALLFDRQIVGFDLDHGRATPTVLGRARAAADIRPDAAGLDTVAWAAYRLGDLAAARTESARALASGSIDARILYHAAAIALASGDATGRALVGRALDLGPALDPLDRASAEALLRG
jgi:tetratricopeptide (TPR) repeat protein